MFAHVAAGSVPARLLFASIMAVTWVPLHDKGPYHSHSCVLGLRDHPVLFVHPAPLVASYKSIKAATFAVVWQGHAAFAADTSSIMPTTGRMVSDGS